MNILMNKLAVKPALLQKNLLLTAIRLFTAEAPTAPQYQNIIVEKKEGGVGLV